MNNLIKSAIASVLLLGGGYLTADRFTPGWTAELRGFVSESGGEWSENAIRNDPAGYLGFTRTRLERQKEGLTQLVGEIRQNMAPLEQHVQERTEELAKTDAFLREGRQVYRDAQKVAETQTVQAIRFAGRMYPDLPTFKAQLELLFAEKQNGETLLKQARETQKRLSDRLYAMLLQQGKLEMAIQEIGPQIAIVRAEVTTRRLDEILNRTRTLADGVVKSTAKMVEEYGPIGTTKDLLGTAQNAHAAAPGFNAEFQAFLNGPSSS